MSLVAVLGPVNTILTTNGSLSLTPGTPALELAATPRRDRTSTPRVTWVPTTDQFVMRAAAMTKAFMDAYHTANPGKQIQRQLFVKLAGVEAHCWAGTVPGSADDYSLTEVLVNAVLSALRHQMYGSFEVHDSGWVNPRSSEGNILGHRYVLKIAIAMPVLEVQDNAPGTNERTTLTTFTPQTNQMGPIPPGGNTYTNP